MELDSNWKKIYGHFQRANTDRQGMWQPHVRMMVKLIPRLMKHPGFADVQLSIAMLTLCFTVPEKAGIVKVIGKTDETYEIRYWRNMNNDIDDSKDAEEDAVIEIILDYIEKIKKTDTGR